MALVAFLAFVGDRRPPLPAPGRSTARRTATIAHENIIRRVVARRRRAASSATRTGKVLASSRPAYNVYVVPGRVMPSARPAAPTAPADRRRPRLVAAHRRHPAAQPRGARALRGAHPRRVRERRGQVALLAPASSCARTSRATSSPSSSSTTTSSRASTSSASRSATTRTRTSARTCSATWPRSTPRRSRSTGPPGYDELAARRAAARQPARLRGGRHASGATGVERAWESYLRGQRGWEKRVVDARGRYRSGPEAERPRRPAAAQDPIPGRDLRLTIDMELEQAIERAMRPQRRGRRRRRRRADRAAPRALLEARLRPERSRRAAAGSARVREAFNRLYADPLRPMLDKTMSGAFQPGSTFKPFSALAALEDNADRPRRTPSGATGYVVFGRRIFRCTHVHGKVRHARGDRRVVQHLLHPPRRGGRHGPHRARWRRPSSGSARRRASASTPRRPGACRRGRGTRSATAGSSASGFTLNTAIGEGDDDA